MSGEPSDVEVITFLERVARSNVSRTLGQAVQFTLTPSRRSWILDWRAAFPATLHDGTSLPADVLVEVDGGGFGSLLGGQLADGALHQLFDSAVAITSLDRQTDLDDSAPALAQQLRAALLAALGATGNLQAPVYQLGIAMFPDRRWTFMNFGYAEAEQDFSWLRAEDHADRYALSLTRHTLADLDLHNKRVLDLGCGRGGTCSYLARYTGAREILGVDACARQIEWCTTTHRHPRLHFARGDAQALALPDGRFDVVLSLESAHCYPDLFRFFVEVRRVLAPGGYLCYADNSALDASWHAGLLEEAGFRVQRALDITAEVGRAVAANRETQAALFRDISHDTPFVGVAEQLAEDNTIVAQELFANRRLLYHSVLAQRPRDERISG